MAIAQELFLLCSRVGIPTEILTDQGMPFVSQVIADLCRLLKVKHLRTSVYHPQTDGLVERFNKTLKQMLKGLPRAIGKSPGQAENSLQHALRPLALLGPSFWPAWGSSHIPTSNGYCPVAPPGVRRHLY